MRYVASTPSGSSKPVHRASAASPARTQYAPALCPCARTEGASAEVSKVTAPVAGTEQSTVSRSVCADDSTLAPERALV